MDLLIELDPILNPLKSTMSPFRLTTQDPRGLDYLNYANVSIRICDGSCTGVGDCDDLAILMASLVESIGRTTRIILAFNNSTGGDAYAEVYLGNLRSQPRQINDTIDWFKHKYSTNNILTYNDMETGDVWLNLDWGLDEKGNAHPEGLFARQTKKLLSLLEACLRKLPSRYHPQARTIKHHKL
jgi:hypothetical protein